jgi:hypothetical protein
VLWLCALDSRTHATAVAQQRKSPGFVSFPSEAKAGERVFTRNQQPRRRSFTARRQARQVSRGDESIGLGF